MEIADLKHKLRELKKLEARIRGINKPSDQHKRFIWSTYFSTRDENDTSVKYSMRLLSGMSRNELKAVFDEYFFHVYYQYFKECGIESPGLYNTALLSGLGLPPQASMADIKKRFRELAKQYHPDLGGDPALFIQLMETYEKLIGDERSMGR
jgi:hypothetical protein